jgi:hypothetical protein
MFMRSTVILTYSWAAMLLNFVQIAVEQIAAIVLRSPSSFLVL